MQVRCEMPELNCGIALETVLLEYFKGVGNCQWSGEMC